jgi:hypothetical protein
MKNLNLILLMGTILEISSIQFSLSQNDLVVFNDGGEKFYLYVNGVKQNTEPETNVRVTAIKQPWVRVKVVFVDNKRIPDLTTNADFIWDNEEKNGWEFVYQIVNKTGKYKIKFYSAAPISNTPNKEQTVVNYSTQEPSPNVSVSPANTNVSLNTQTVTSTTVVTTGGQNTSPNSTNNNGSVGISVNISPTNAGVQIHDNMSSPNASSGYTTSVVSTTVTSSSSMSNENVATTSVPRPVSPKVICSVSEKEFESIKKSISSKSFEDSKLTLAKQICDSKCLKSTQVRDIMKLFSFEATKLEFAKYAYNKVLDKENYYVVNDAFQFESSIEELNENIKE